MSRRTTPVSTADALRQSLRRAGLRRTAPRIAVLQQLAHARTPVTHGDLVTALARRGFDRATIYRNLIDLSEAGLVSRTDLGDHVWRFELRAEHPHFMCTDCGRVACLPGVTVQIRPGRGSPRAVRSRDIAIRLQGRCDRCA